MSRSKILVTVALGVVVITAIVILVIMMRNQPARHFWLPHYNDKGIVKKEPYGLYYFRQLITNRRGSGRTVTIKKPVAELFRKGQPERGLYLFAGDKPYYTDKDASALIRYAEEGNRVLLIVNDLPEQFLRKLGLVNEEPRDVFIIKSSDTINATLPFADPGHQYRFWFQMSDSTLPFSWRFLNLHEFSRGVLKDRINGLTNGDDVHFYEVDVGRGKIMIHTNPILFTNYFLITEEGYRYASKVFSFLNEDEDIYYDRGSHSPGTDFSLHDPGTKGSWIGFVLRSPGLRWAWYLLLLLAMLFILFRSRRRQRAIPVVEPNENSVMEYIQTLGQIYFKHKNHRQIALQQHQLFMHHLAVRLKLRVNQPNELLIQDITAKTGVPEERVAALFDQATEISRRKSITAKELLGWYESLHYFYTYSKPMNYGDNREKQR